MCYIRLAALLLLFACGTSGVIAPPRDPYTIVLGIAQDGGYPQAGCRRPDCLDAFDGKRQRALVASLAIVDPVSGERWIVDATPDLPAQLHRLEQIAGPPRHGAPVLNGILLTHAHVGHYIGLSHLGREVMGTRGVPVFAMPRMRAFLEQNGPWSQLVALKNIELRTLTAGQPVSLNERISVTPLLVPHRDEFSETVGHIVRLRSRSLLWLPDIDKWEKWSTPIETLVSQVDVAFVDATFFSADELPGRDLREIPHPLVVETMARFRATPELTRRKIVFIHLNQSNPLLRNPALRRSIEADGYSIAREGAIYQ